MKRIILALLLFSSSVTVAQVTLYDPYESGGSPSVVETLHANALDDQLEFGSMVANVDDDPELETIIVVRGIVDPNNSANTAGKIYIYDDDGDEFTGSPLVSLEFFSKT